jgi:AcrR family transcriptional regulator
MTSREESVRERLVLATIDCIEKLGPGATTTRAIAREAKVNVAAVNYYFGSKARLVEEALRQTLREGFDNMIAEIWVPNENRPYQAFRSQLIAQLEGMIEWPGLLKAHFYGPFLRDDYSGQAPEALNKMLTYLDRRTRQLFPKSSAKERRLSLAQIMSALLFAGLFPNLFKDFWGMDLRNPKDRRRYIDHLLKSHLPESVMKKN